MRNLRRTVLILHEITSLAPHGAANSHNLYAIVEHLVGLQRSDWVNAARALPWFRRPSCAVLGPSTSCSATLSSAAAANACGDELTGGEVHEHRRWSQNVIHYVLPYCLERAGRYSSRMSLESRTLVWMSSRTCSWIAGIDRFPSGAAKDQR